MDLPLLHARQARPFIDFFTQAGLPTERLLRQVRLPAALIDPVDGYIAERLLWELIDVAAYRAGMDDLGLQIGRTIDLDQLGGLAERLSLAPTLYCALDSFRHLARGESSHANFWVMRHLGVTWFCRGGIDSIEAGRHHTELYALLMMIEAIRVATGPAWRPSMIQLQTDAAPGIDQCQEFADAAVQFGRPVTAVAIPAFVESVAWREQKMSEASAQPNDASPLQTHDLDLAAALRLLLRPYLGDRAIPKIELAADILGISARTLQRRLAKSGLKYSQVLDQMRFQASLPLLKDPNNSVLEIAYSIGYSDPAHFTHAFRRWSGLSPREYRRLRQWGDEPRGGNYPEIV